ncbi:uncharacterized protein EI97DRAFT_435430 [Westerdykella ornata]|uniref:N-terminal of MaoC-like dehydratase domain-containing protein n=1 Tax=Westerdykella ornata TaxID=318751 RepID=A0A6A6JFT7_WESOR|nr:uncharacterized protein EI97DRAFT_435430 [Westerdykella ornata]KAF2274059.1 hypothetical protein EI97DRAFT_435430 [Westerdykella ornata]
MSHITRRLLSITTPRRSSAAEACSELLERFDNKPVSIRRQLLDRNQTQLLSLTLGRPEIHKGVSIADSPPADGTPLPPGYHLVYFTPAILEQDLGRDGTDRTVNPIAPYTRRMWAGGELKWSQDPSSFLRVGQTIQETTKLLSAVSKKLKTGADMLVVGVEKTYTTEEGDVALIDNRNWVFQEEIVTPQAPPPRPKEEPFPEGRHARDFCQTGVTLFRFSALTFNAHKIHYSPQWCREVEGQRDSVVHGPLNLINILDFWRDTARGSEEGAIPRSISYRAMSPLYVGEKYRLLLERTTGKEENGGWKATIWDSFGKRSLKGAIEE